MTKNKLHCLVINEPKKLKPTLAGLFDYWEGKVIVEVIDSPPNIIIKKLLKGNINLVFTRSNNKVKLEKYRNILRRYSMDTILVNQSVKNRPLLTDLSGVESCSIHLEDPLNSPVLVNNLLSYAQIKKDFRNCKHLLSVTDKRNRWLVSITPEPIAYLYKGTHIHANAAYLSVFGFQSIAELKSASIWDLIPEKSQNMFKKFIKKQHRQHKQLDMQQTLLMTMNTTDKTQIRTGIRIAPAVINKTKCLQIWIHKIEDTLDKIESIHENKSPLSPWENLPEKKPVITQSKPSKLQPSNVQPSRIRIPSGLKQSIKTVALELQPLTDTNESDVNHFLATLAFNHHEQSHLTTALKKTGAINNLSIYWDRLLLTKLFKELGSSHQSKNQYLISLTTSSFNNNNFLNFLIRGLKSLLGLHPHIVFLLPHNSYKKQHQRFIKVHKILQTMKCSLGIHDFVPDKVSLQKVISDKPSYLSFSSKWVDKLADNRDSHHSFTQLTEKLEKKGIQVILS